ncbi:MAG TPA: endopeptidase La [Acidimicrobiia bacterium]|nr:endopeptidase La [Acidimicrobiia bacterium]
MVVTLALETDEAKAAADAATVGDGELLLVPRIDGRYARVGTIARVESAGELPNGVRALVLRGVQRATVGVGVAGTSAGLWVEAVPVDDSGEPTERARELARDYRAIVGAIAERLGTGRLREALQGVTDPGALADTAGWWPNLEAERKVELLETLDVEQRLEKVVAWARDALAEIDVAEKIRSEVTDGMERQQREFLLRQQLAAIKKELGEDGDDDVVEDYRRRIAEGGLPEGVRDSATREVDRLERTSEQSPEHGWIRTWLDSLLDVPWGERSDDNLDVNDARRVLDGDHTGLSDVKDRIVELLAVRKLRAERGFAETDGRRGAGAILALVGPPGVGKTSLGESVARALGRKFTRVALGGIHDEAEIRGHRRTYVGARPGRVVRALTEAGTMNPVVLLDEIDKVGADWRGDPSSALLEVLDPAQNHTFRDHYLEVDLDLSDVLFLVTANVAETIPGPLFDRLEVIRLDGYTEDEKVAIARDHLLVRQRDLSGLRQDDVTVGDDALRLVVTDYTREAGVRNLEREIGKLLRKVAARLVSGDLHAPVNVDEAVVRDALGRPKFFNEVADRVNGPGVATGLAVTGSGGDVLFIEASVMDGEPGLTLTGQLGDVMKESAQIALSYVQAHVDELGIEPTALNRRVHLHVPAGAVPKDGPSAGITMTTALASLLSGRAVRNNVGLTGEVTLQGRVLPIGGVKQKVLAAQRAGLTEVILPARNRPDLDDVPEATREALSFHLVDDVRDVLTVALEPEALPNAA